MQQILGLPPATRKPRRDVQPVVVTRLVEQSDRPAEDSTAATQRSAAPMHQIEIDIPDIDDTPAIARRVETVLAAHGLTMHSRGSVRKYAGCIHWHWKNGRQSGTLEVTLWPAKRRLWFKVQAGRRAPWIDQLVPALKADLEKG